MHFDAPSWTNAGVVILILACTVAIACLVITVGRWLALPRCPDCWVKIKDPTLYRLIQVALDGKTTYTVQICKSCFTKRVVRR
jgi:hypothetical protein